MSVRVNEVDENHVGTSTSFVFVRDLTAIFSESNNDNGNNKKAPQK